ncbi:alkaline phosphatase family protein [Methylocapsa aurea]|uniref:alkaline phosphatase family protein n=1 Tax=Methylocapsa aurea TaxID=663610 RepID=UPI001FD97947|nr:alkaline phosphatase family protein [Methylocapsa aurea]
MRLRFTVAVCAVALTLSPLGFGAATNAETLAGKSAHSLRTASPIKHVIIIVGENRSFDHLFATYAPKRRDEKILNLLSQGIVKADGAPGPHFAKAKQYKITSAPNGDRFFISAGHENKTLYTTLPAPDIGGVPAASPLAFILNTPGGDPGIPQKDQYLFGTGGTGLPVTLGPDTRIANVTTLPPGPFQLTGPGMPYDAFTADTIHQFFQMYQQMDCAIDKEHASRENPTGCLKDLQSAITTTYNTPLGGTPHDTGQTMAFFNMQQGDAAITKRLADKYTISDNYHQSVMGGTGPDSIPLGFADQIYFGDSTGKAATPIATRIYNPNPQPGTLNLYTLRAQWFNCSDESAPGVKPIADYLRALPYKVDTKCDPGHYYPAVNVGPAFTPAGIPTGAPDNANPTNNIIPPVYIRSIGDVMNDHHIPWIYYGGGYKLSVAGAAVNGYCTICNPFEHQANYPSLRADHMRDVTDLFTDLAKGTLPAVSYVKPDGALDGHPASSKWGLFEAFVDNIITLAQSNKEQWAETAIFVTADEGGGYYDSGFIQPVDFFGTGPRVPMIAVSPFSTGGHVSHVYNEHSSFVKFIERNWKLKETLTKRSRDNLPNPRQNDHNVYVPSNMPAIGDLFDMFDFDRHDDYGHDNRS